MKGFTLIETMIALLLFTAIVAVIGSVILFSQRAYIEGQRVMEAMQNGRVVSDATSREIRQARNIISSLPEERENAVEEIIFHDGHLEEVKERENAQGGSENVIVLSENSFDQDGFYEDLFLKVVDGPFNLIGNTAKIISYDGETREAVLENALDKEAEYGGIEYIIDSSYYYIHYYLTEKGFVKRKIFTHYFSGEPDNYVPFNATPPEGQTLEKEILEEPRIIGEHFEKLKFWGVENINIKSRIEVEGKSIELIKSVFGRNL